MTAELEEALRLREAAREHSRAARRHRNRARECMAKLDRLIADAATRGVQIQINNIPPGDERQDQPRV